MRGVCAIFKEKFAHTLKRITFCASKIYNGTKSVKTAIFAFVALVAIMASLWSTGTRIAYKVNYNGNIIATVGDKQHFFDAVNLVSKRVNGDVASVVDKPEFSAAIVLDKDIDRTDKVADAIISNTDEIVSATTLSVNSQVVVCAEKSTIDALLQSRLDSFKVAGSECSNRFIDYITTQDGYYMLSEIDSADEAKSVINTLSVVTEMRQTSDVIVPYKSTVQTTKEQVVGYQKVTVSGVSGVNRVTQDVVMLNGVEQSRVDVDTQVVVAPVDEVIVKGTAKNQATADQKQQAIKAGFLFPLPGGTWQVSSYYGDGRNHKGVDLRAPSGTSIYAVADGTVVLAKWNGNYGNCVIIEHSNGMRTLYGHAKQLCCSVGDTVSAGEVIALVGTTGQSTGNHLHFEVISGGKNVNPAPYINLD